VLADPHKLTTESHTARRAHLSPPSLHERHCTAASTQIIRRREIWRAESVANRITLAAAWAPAFHSRGTMAEGERGLSGGSPFQSSLHERRRQRKLFDATEILRPGNRAESNSSPLPLPPLLSPLAWNSCRPNLVNLPKARRRVMAAQHGSKLVLL
jgi:hypothetical protein